MKKNDWKDRLNVVYSTNPDFQYEQESVEEATTLEKHRQPLRVGIERKGRGGKTVTVVKGFTGTENDLRELGKLLKIRCGTGGAVKDGDILIQGDMKKRVTDVLWDEGYTQTK